MPKRRKRNTYVKVVDKRNERFKTYLWEDVDELAGYVGDLDLDIDAKNHIMEGVANIANLAESLLDCTELPKRGLRPSFNRRTGN